MCNKLKDLFLVAEILTKLTKDKAKMLKLLFVLVSKIQKIGPKQLKLRDNSQQVCKVKNPQFEKHQAVPSLIQQAFDST